MKNNKKEIEDIPSLDEREEASAQEYVEPSVKEPTKETKQEENKLHIVTNEQLTQFKLDTLSSQVQEITSQIEELINILTKPKKGI